MRASLRNAQPRWTGGAIYSILRRCSLVRRLRKHARLLQRLSRRRPMIRRPVLILLASIIALGFGATSVLSQGAPGKVAMLLPGSVNDQSWNAAGYAGLLKLKD